MAINWGRFAGIPFFVFLGAATLCLGQDQTPQISAEIDDMGKLIGERLGPHQMALIGGTVADLLLAMNDNRPFRPRDVDLSVTLSQIPSDADVEAFMERANAKGKILPIRRVIHNNGRPTLAEVGKYISVEIPSGTVFDISFIEDPKLLAENGLVNTEKMVLPLPTNLSLRQWRAMHSGKSIQDLREAAVLIDQHAGFESLLNGVVKIVGWSEIELNPLPAAVRVIRAAGKVQPPKLSVEDVRRLESAIKNTKPSEIDIIRFEGRLHRVFNDRYYREELSMLRQLGAPLPEGLEEIVDQGFGDESLDMAKCIQAH